MTWAYAIAGRSVFDEVYGWDIQEAFDRATEGVLPRATIDLSFDRDPRVVVIDGEVVYERGPRTVTATFSSRPVARQERLALQKEWFSNPERRSSSEARRPQKRGERPPSKNNERAKPQRSNREFERDAAETRRVPRPPGKSWKALRLHLTASGGYGLMLARCAQKRCRDRRTAPRQAHLDTLSLI